MGDIVAATIKHTASDAGVSALVGSRVSVFGVHRSDPSAGTPYITVESMGEPDEDHIAGHAGLAEATVLIKCVGMTYASAQSVRSAVLSAWRGLANTDIATGGGTVRVISCHVADQPDATSGPSAGRNTPIFINMVQLKLWYATA